MSANELSTLEKMVSLSSQWETVGDRRYAFLKCYGMMTANMFSALEKGQFVDRVWVHVLLEHFADYYFRALDSYQQLEPASPRVWQVAFRAANQAELQLVQHLLLGVNAHINYDLVYAVVDLLAPEWKDLAPQAKIARHQDYCLVNDIISQTIDAVQDDILEKDNRIMQFLDSALVNIDEWMIGRFVKNWRDQVWSQAIRLIVSEDEDTTRILHDKVEARALHLAGWIMKQPLINPKYDLRRIRLSL